jgi:DedD protein
MSAERKKLLWISISACVFVLIVLAVGFFLLTPKQGGAQAPATIGNSAPPKAQDPQDFLSAPPPAPSLEQPHTQDGGMIIVYGDKPSLPEATKGASGSAASSVPAAASPVPAAPAAAASQAQGASAKAATAAKAPAIASRPAAKTAVGQKAAAAQRPATAKVDEFWIQTASFTSRGRADELRDALAGKGIAALINVKDISGKSYYRVRVGPYSVKAEADDWLARLKGLPGCAEAYVSKTVAQKAKQ